MKKRILVCGATGFIGRNIAEFLGEKQDFEVYGTYLNSEPLRNPKINMVHADMTDKEDVERVIKGMDIVIQAAATTSGAKDIVNSPYYHVTDNAIMNSLIFRSAYEHKVSHVIFFSCTVMYPSSESPLKETDFDANQSIHSAYFGVGWTKVYIEKLCEFYSNISSAKYTVIRHSNIYGPYDKFDLEHSHVFGATITKVMTAENERLVVWGDGEEKRDLLYVSDLVNFVDIVINRQNSKFGLYNVGYGTSISVKDLTKKIVDYSGKDIKIEYDLSKPTIKVNCCIDISKARNTLGWNPKVSLDDGIRKTVDWYASTFKKSDKIAAIGLDKIEKGIDLVLVKPGGRDELFGSLASSLSGFAPPIDIGLIASFVRSKGHSVRIIDADAEFLTPKETANRIAEYSPILVGIFAHTVRMMHAGKIIEELKEGFPDIKILLGGRHASALPEKTLLEEGPDFVCQGEGFYPLLELLEFLKRGDNRDYKIKGIWYRKNGSVISNPPHPLLKDLDGLPLIAWDLLPMDRYRAHNWLCFDDLENRKPYAIIYTSMGCPFGCTYCCVNTTYGSSGIRFRSPEKVIEEIDHLVKNYNVRNIRIVDDIFTFKPERVMHICNLIIERNYDLNIWCYARVDTVSESMLKKMKQAGIRWVCYGIEAGHEKVREGVFKRIKLDTIKEAVKMTREAGIYIMANFVFGLPDDNIETMQETLNMAMEFNFEYVNFYVAMAWPGSKLYLEAVKKGIRLPDTWNGYAQLAEESLPLPTKYLTSSQVLNFRDKAFIEYFSSPRYLEMIRQKFGSKVEEHIKNMLRYQIHRKFV